MCQPRNQVGCSALLCAMLCFFRGGGFNSRTGLGDLMGGLSLTAGFGPSVRGFGSSICGFGSSVRGFGSSVCGFDSSVRGFGPNEGGFGPNEGGFGPNTGGFGSVSLRDIHSMEHFREDSREDLN